MQMFHFIFVLHFTVVTVHLSFFLFGLNGKASIPTDDLIPLVRRCRNNHSMAYQVRIANADI